MDKKWYQKHAIYQIYPRSFYDASGDGIGDLPGITAKLDYIQDLGIGAIWLSPFYRSPMADFGYDVSDHCDVDPLFGTLADFDALLQAAHARDIKVLVDYIPNHTSDKHLWFLESRSSKDNPKRDWYIWREGTKDAPPNNWLAVFGGSGWEWDETTSSYYYHSFLKEQPDLNWRNPEVQEAMKDVLRFWLDRGADGFRIDAVYQMYKDTQWRDNPPNPNYKPGYIEPNQSHLNIYNYGLPETLDMLGQFCTVLSQYKDTFIVTESYAPVPEMLPFFKICSAKILSPLNMNLILLPWSVEAYRTVVEEIEKNVTMEDTPNYVLGNHDRSRVATRVGEARARLSALLLLTLRGMPFIYYGEEIGMENVPVKTEDAQDPFEKRVPGMGLGRDPERSPMQWSSAPNAGFTTGKPWLPVAEDFREKNVETESNDPSSMLNLYKTLLHLRTQTPGLVEGAYASIATDNPNLYVYSRETPSEKLLVILNFSEEAQPARLLGSAEVLITTEGVPASPASVDLNALELRPYEGYLLRRLKSDSRDVLPATLPIGNKR